VCTRGVLPTWIVSIVPFCPTPAVVFSDVDGTLLSEEGWALPPAKLRDILGGRPLVLASSRTLRELVLLQRTLGIDAPVVAENGAVIALTRRPTPEWGEERVIGRRTLYVQRLGRAAHQLQRRVREAADEAGVFVRFADEMPTAELARLGIGSRGAFARAVRAREASVLLTLPAMDDATLSRWHHALDARSIIVSAGGRWACAVGAGDKGRAAKLVHLYMGWSGATLGMGDDSNDEPLLTAVDHAVVVRRPDGRVHPNLSRIPGAMICQLPGVRGTASALRATLGSILEQR
jgi:mannosyl-3-phosphoglycerate phosphatase